MKTRHVFQPFKKHAIWTLAVAAATTLGAIPSPARGAEATPDLEKAGAGAGVCAILGSSRPGQAADVIKIARAGRALIYFQALDADEAASVRRAAEEAGLLGTRLFVDQGDRKSIHLADNLADLVLARSGEQDAATRREILRVLRPEGKAILGDQVIVKPLPQGADPWSHPYHGPDNNPQSADQIARAPYLTQFLAAPMFCPMPEVSVAAGGRVFRAFGHIAHKANQNAMLNTLICANGYNGQILWTRPLREGFMIHRNTMIATNRLLYLADDQSCKRLDARTGKLIDEIVIPEGLADGPVWKWMALHNGVLYALVGGQEVKPATQRSDTPGMGHWPWGMWQGYDYSDPKSSFGFGRTFVAIEPDSKKILWRSNEEDYVDSRGVCMKNGRIYFYVPDRRLACLDAKTGKTLWRNSDPDLLEAIGPNQRAQGYVTGYSTTTYIKCTDDYLFFAGPERKQFVVASARDGKVVWSKDQGNWQLVLREDAVYAAGPQDKDASFKLAYDTGRILATLPHRRACTRATGSIDSVFFRASGGTVRIDTASDTAQHIAPMRPPCQDGVIISDGMLYWGPWMCGCQLSLYGHIGLAPAGDFNFHPAVDASRLEVGLANARPAGKFDVAPGDWPAYRGDNGRSSTTKVALPQKARRRWSFHTPASARPTAPVAAGGLVFLGDTSGAVRALDAETGKIRWRTDTGGAIYFPPAVWKGVAYVGSADGRLYALDAATGQRRWVFRAAPAEQWIPVYGKLMSRWPVVGGVVADRGVVYAAAGITHYDGVYVYALDADSGKVKWCNDTSGEISRAVHCGVSLQGELYVRDGQLRFLGGNAYETARYDLETGKCLNEPDDTVTSRYHTAFYPYFPEYGKYLSLDQPLPDGKRLVCDASYEGSRHSPLALLPAGASHPAPEASRWYSLRRRGAAQKTVWRDRSGRIFSAFVVGPDMLLAAGESGPNDGRKPFLAAIRIEDGSDAWRQPLAASVVPGGAAVDHSARIFVSLDNGDVVCYAGTRNGETNAAE